MIAFLFDTETTGLLSNHLLQIDKQPEIIELYGCLADLSTGLIINELDLLIKPSQEISEEITGITGITNEMVKDAKPFKEYAEAIVDAIEAAPMVIAHNLSYDMEMVDLELERLKRKVVWPAKLCTVEQTLHLKGFRLSLSNLHEHLFGAPFSGAHRASVDVQALLRVCVELYAREEL